MSIKTGNPEHDLMIKLYVEEHLSVAKLTPIVAKQFGKKYSRTWITKVLNKYNVDTRKGFGTRVEKKCFMCDKPFTVNRARHHAQSGNFYCSKECWYKSLYFENSVDDRRGRDKGRVILANAILETIKLPARSVLHHSDHNQANNTAKNLILFIDQATHMKYHRNCPFDHDNILYDGSYDSPEYRKQCALRIKKMLGTA